MQKPTFYFFEFRTATRFHISRKLLSLGWEKSHLPREATFGDHNLTLNDEISKHFEYKHLLAQLVDKYCPDIMPITYWVNDHNYKEVFAKIIYDHYMVNNQYGQNVKNLKWILKPSMLNNGDQIKLFNNIEELKKYYASAKRLGGDHVCQQYLPNPDLILSRKYTFRVSAVLTNYAGVFFYKQGYINISGYPFNLDDGFIMRKAHITNYVLDGEFANIEQRSTQTINNFEQIYQQMCSIVIATLKALLKEFPNFLKPQKTKIFEIFGFDFILDQNGKIWLLEINQSPDAPTFENNCLDDLLWKGFWQDIIDDFVLPIGLKVLPKNNYSHFTQLLSKNECYSPWRNVLRIPFSFFKKS